eukprot:ctg_2168.g343
MQGFPKLQIPRPPGGPGGVRLLSVGVTTAIGAVAFYKYALFNKLTSGVVGVVPCTALIFSRGWPSRSDIQSPRGRQAERDPRGHPLSGAVD